MSLSRTDGIVLRTYPYREADLIVRVLSAQQGKLSVIARGARKSKKRAPVEIFDRGLFELSPSRGGMYSLRNCNLRSSYREIRESLDKLSVASLLCESFDMLIPDGESGDCQQLFDLLDLGFQAIAESDRVKSMLRVCCLSLGSFLTLYGVSSADKNRAPGAKELLRLITVIESESSRELKSKPMVLGMVQQLRQASES